MREDHAVLISENLHKIISHSVYHEFVNPLTRLVLAFHLKLTLCDFDYILPNLMYMTFSKVQKSYSQDN